MLFIARISTVHFQHLSSQCRKATRQQKCTRHLHLYRKHFCYSALSQTQDKKSHLKLLSAIPVRPSVETEVAMIAALCFTTILDESQGYRGEIIPNELPI